MREKLSPLPKPTVDHADHDRVALAGRAKVLIRRKVGPARRVNLAAKKGDNAFWPVSFPM